MDRAKASVNKVLGRSGQHDTTIHETVAPAVQHETVNQTQHETATTAIDREVHQDHYHTSEQPIQHSEVLPEQHHHREATMEHRSFEHDNADNVKRRLEEERAKYRDHSQRVEGEKTYSAEPTVAGEHKHHHVHETIQPVIQKQTIEPHVVHTVVPVHEVHHNEAQHHSSSALPPVSMEDFKKQGGTLGGREERQDHFKGEPRSFGGALKDHGGQISHADREVDGSPGAIDGGRGLTGHEQSRYGTETGVGREDNVGSDRYGTDGGIGRDTGYGSSNTTSSTEKPSLMDKLNPKVDASGDGKAGFMK